MISGSGFDLWPLVNHKPIPVSYRPQQRKCLHIIRAYENSLVKSDKWLDQRHSTHNNSTNYPHDTDAIPSPLAVIDIESNRFARFARGSVLWNFITFFVSGLSRIINLLVKICIKLSINALFLDQSRQTQSLQLTSFGLKDWWTQWLSLISNHRWLLFFFCCR